MPNANSCYVAKKAAVLTNPITNDSIFLSSDNSAYSAFVGVPGAEVVGNSLIDGGEFRVRASGKVHIPTTSSTLIVTLYYSTAARTAITYNATGVSSVCAITFGSMTAAYNSNWTISAKLQWDYTSLILNGQYEGIGGPTPTVTSPTVTTQLTSIDLSANGVGFIVGCHLGSSGVASTVTLSNFALEVL